MKTNFTSIFILLVLVFQAQPKMGEGKLENKHYLDTIKCENRFGLKIIQVKINGADKNLIFDTGADIILLSKDTMSRGMLANSKVTDANGKSVRSSLEILKDFAIQGLTYTDLASLKIDFPKPLVCLSDGLMGNNVIKKSNWQITENYLIVSDKPFKNDNIKSFPFFYYASNSLYLNTSINGIAIDTCLLDYGSRSEIELPMKYYDALKYKLKSANKNFQKISAKWTVTGKTLPDTSLIFNSTIDLFGIAIDSVNVVFSNKIKRPKLGINVLNRFKAVYIDNKSEKLGLQLPVNLKRGPAFIPAISIDIDGEYFKVDGKILTDELNSTINIGDKLRSVNEKKPSDFESYCSFLNWISSLANVSKLRIVFENNKEVQINNF